MDCVAKMLNHFANWKRNNFDSIFKILGAINPPIIFLFEPIYANVPQTIKPITMSEIARSFFNWAFERHQNPLSWFIRPLFIIPYCYFAHQHSLLGIIITLILLFTSMFWFPKPKNPDPRILHFLEFEKKWLTQPWTIKKTLLTLIVPVSMFLLAYAFWMKSIVSGFVLINGIALGKIAWSVIYDKKGGWMVIPFAVFGMIVCDIVIYYYVLQKM